KFFSWIHFWKVGPAIRRQVQKIENFIIAGPSLFNELIEQDRQNLFSGEDIIQPLHLGAEHAGAAVPDNLRIRAIGRYAFSVLPFLLQTPGASKFFHVFKE